MNISNIVKKIKNKQVVLIKNIALASTLADLVIYYLEGEKDSEFTKSYLSLVGKDFNYEKALTLYLDKVQHLDVTVTVDHFYTKIIPNG